MHTDKISKIFLELRAEIRKNWLRLAVSFIGSHAFAFFLFTSHLPENMQDIAYAAALLALAAFYAFVFFFFWNIRPRLWKQFAKLHGWTYEKEKMSVFGRRVDESSALFQIRGFIPPPFVVRGVWKEFPFRAFEYGFYKDHHKEGEFQQLTIFGFSFKGIFPHLYLNSSKNDFDPTIIVERVPLPHEFEKSFRLYAPKKYEMEALQIFTPDILHQLLSSNVYDDIEFVDGEMFIIISEYVWHDLENELKKADHIRSMFVDALNAMRFAPVGDNSPTLRAHE